MLLRITHFLSASQVVYVFNRELRILDLTVSKSLNFKVNVKKYYYKHTLRLSFSQCWQNVLHNLILMLYQI